MKQIIENINCLAHIAAISASAGFGLTTGIVFACVVWG
jgi:hypothetical protein